MSASVFGWTLVGVFLVVMLLWAYFGDRKPPQARPGSWYGDYNRAWHKAHPGAWERQEGQPGSFRKSGWGSCTLAWDEQWFAGRGMRLPRGAHEVPVQKDPPGVFRLAAVLEPGESASFSLDPETGEITNHGVSGGRPSGDPTDPTEEAL